MKKKILNLGRPSKEYYAGPIFVYVSNENDSIDLEIDEEDRNSLLRAVENKDSVTLMQNLEEIAEENDEQLLKDIVSIDLELWFSQDGDIECVDLISFLDDYESIDWSSYNPEEWK